MFTVTLCTLVESVSDNDGTRMNASLQNGWTALRAASIAGNVQCLRMLLDRCADVNMQDKVSGVIIPCVHAMQHIPRVPRSG